MPFNLPITSFDYRLYLFILWIIFHIYSLGAERRSTFLQLAFHLSLSTPHCRYNVQSMTENATKNGGRDPAVFSKRESPLCSRRQCHGAAHRFLFASIQLPGTINRAACGVIWHSTGQKPRDECHRTDVPPAGKAPLVIHERAHGCVKHRSESQETPRARAPRHRQRESGGVFRKSVFILPLPPLVQVPRIRISRLAACPESWKRDGRKVGVNDAPCLRPSYRRSMHLLRGSSPFSQC